MVGRPIGLDILETYDRLIADCQTINQIFMRNLSLELTMTPAEVAELYENLRDNERYWSTVGDRWNLTAETIRAVADNWLDHFRGLLLMARKQAVEPFLRTELLKSVTRYSDGRPPQGKWLVIVFGGAAFRPMMPAAAFLQQFDASSVDVVMLRDYHRKGFRLGITEVSRSVEETFSVVPKLLETTAYRGVSIVGTSGGAIPALQYSIATDASAVAIAGHSPPHDPSRRLPDGRLPADLIVELARREKLPRMTVLYGRESMDRPAAEAVAAMVPVDLVEVSDPATTVGHNALLPLMKRGELAESMTRWLELPGGGNAGSPLRGDRPASQVSSFDQ